MLYFHNELYKFWENAWFFDKYAMKNKIIFRIRFKLPFLPMASKNIDFDHLCPVIVRG